MVSKKRGNKGGKKSAASKSPSQHTYEDWVWWPNVKGRRSRAEEEFFDLPADAQGELLDRIKRLLEGATRSQDVDHILQHGLRELRVRRGNNHYRILFFVSGNTCVGLTCFYKNQNRTERADIERARKRMNSYGA